MDRQSEDERADHTITVEGGIDLGEEMVLEESVDSRRASRSSFVHVMGSVLAPHESRALSRLPNKDVQRDEVVHTLRKTGRQLSMKNQGLVLQYGIFGGPGSGKTNLLMHLLKQIVALNTSSADKFGALIVDPKAALIKGVKKVVSEARRDEDLVVINAGELAQHPQNVLHCAALSPTDLGQILVLAAQSAGIGASDSFWFQQMSKAFGAIFTLINLMEPDRLPTLERLMYYAVGSKWHGASHQVNLDWLIKNAAQEVMRKQDAGPVVRGLQEARLALENLHRYAPATPTTGDARVRPTVEQFMEQAYSIFRLPEYACYSPVLPPTAPNLYDQIINDGKIVLVSTGPQELGLSKIVSSLMKLIFQRTMLGRADRFGQGITNDTRPVLFMADEYHMVATQVEGAAFGDNEYFSQARQRGGLCLVATQNVGGLEHSGLGEAWEAVFGNMAGIIFMQVGDPKTKKYAESVAGNREFVIREQGGSQDGGKESRSWSSRTETRCALPDGAMDVLVRGDAIVIGTTEGTEVARSIHYFHAPRA